MSAFRIAYRALKASGALSPERAVPPPDPKGMQRLGAKTSDPDLGYCHISIWLSADARRPSRAEPEARLEFYVEVVPYEGAVGREQFFEPKFFGPFTMDRHGLLVGKCDKPLLTGNKVSRAGLAAIGSVAGFKVGPQLSSTPCPPEVLARRALPPDFRGGEVSREVLGDEALSAFWRAHFDRSDFRELVGDALAALRTSGELDLSRCMYLEAWHGRRGTRTVDEVSLLILTTRSGATHVLVVDG